MSVEPKPTAQPPATPVRRYNNALNPALLEAVRYQDEKLVDKLLAQGANPNAMDGDKQPALHIALGQRGDWHWITYHYPIAKKLIAAGADARVKGPHGDNAIHLIADTKSSPEQLEMFDLLRAKGVPVDAGNIRGKTALMSAAEHGNIKLVQRLCDAGVNVSRTHKTFLGLTWSALNYVEAYDDPAHAGSDVNAVAQLLISKGSARPETPREYVTEAEKKADELDKIIKDPKNARVVRDLMVLHPELDTNHDQKLQISEAVKGLVDRNVSLAHIRTETSNFLGIPGMPQKTYPEPRMADLEKVLSQPIVNKKQQPAAVAAL